jgi:hypothetical protein
MNSPTSVAALAELGLLVLGIHLSTSGADAHAAGIEFRAARPETVIENNDFVDSPFFSFKGDWDVDGMVANSASWRVHRESSTDPVTREASLRRGARGEFDECGAWLQSVLDDGNLIRGWYHAERRSPECNDSIWKTFKSIAYAESHDDGKSFLKPQYPNNQVITAPTVPDSTRPGFVGEGDHHVLPVGRFLHLNYLATHHPQGWRICIARATRDSGGVPGSWTKFFDGTFSEPGVGGRCTPVAAYKHLARSWVSRLPSQDIFLGFGSSWSDGKRIGFTFSTSKDGIEWRSVDGVVMASRGTWGVRNAASEEISAYPSLAGFDGDPHELGPSFWLYYTHVPHGRPLRGNRRLVRRRVTTSTRAGGASSTSVSMISLDAYESRLEPPRRVVTTAVPPERYRHVETLGYVIMHDTIGPRTIFACTDRVSGTSYAGTATHPCRTGDTAIPVGDVNQAAGPGRVPLYSCNLTRGFITLSRSEQCDGATLIGFVDHD